MLYECNIFILESVLPGEVYENGMGQWAHYRLVADVAVTRCSVLWITWDKGILLQANHLYCSCMLSFLWIFFFGGGY